MTPRRPLLPLLLAGLLLVLGTVATVDGVSDRQRTRRTQAAHPTTAVVTGVIVHPRDKRRRTYGSTADYTARTGSGPQPDEVRIHTRRGARYSLVGQSLQVVRDPRDPGYGELPGEPYDRGVRQWTGTALLAAAAVLLLRTRARSRRRAAAVGPGPRDARDAGGH